MKHNSFREVRRLAALAVAGTFAMALAADVAAAAPWRPSHVVILIEENHAFDQIIGNPFAPFINELAAKGALYTNAYGVGHPSQPNYLALFSGSTQGAVSDDPLPGTPLATPNLAASLIAKGYSFAGFSEDLPAAGSLVRSTAGGYARKHNPWSNWQADDPGRNQLPPEVNQPLSNLPSDFDKLPTVAFIVPNALNDEHGNGTVSDQNLIRTSDQWLEEHIGPYARWAIGHDSLLIVTWDEANFSIFNRIATFLVGARVKPGRYDQRIDHYDVLRAIENFYGLPHTGASGNAAPIEAALP